MKAVQKFLPAGQIVDFVTSTLVEVVSRRAAQGQRTLVLTCGGRTVRSIYEKLGDAISAQQWATVHFGLTDEFAPTEERPNTNAADLEKLFFADAVNRGLIRRDNLHWFDPHSDWSSSLQRYEQELMEVSGGINVVILGAGGGPYWPGHAVDPGHVAAIMPGHPELWEVSASRFGIVEDSPKPPARRMTVLPWAIWETTDAVFGIVTGIEKSGTVANYLAPVVLDQHAPIKVIDRVKSKSYFLSNIQINEI